MKRLGKDIAKKLVASDYKNNRVEDPSAELSEKQSRKMKNFVKDFLDRAVEKFSDHQKRKAARDQQSANAGARPNKAGRPAVTTESSEVKIGQRTEAEAGDGTIIDDEGAESPASADRKRKRETEVADSPGLTPSDGPIMKRLKEEEEADEASPPPPPPPPPESVMEDVLSDEQQALREQEEALMRENEEAQRLEDEARKTGETEKTAEVIQKEITAATDEVAGLEQQHDGSSLEDQSKARNQEVMSH